MTRSAVLSLMFAVVPATLAVAQVGPADRDARLDAVLPAAEAAGVRARAAQARLQGLPADALVLRALELAAKGAAPRDIVRRIGDLSERLVLADLALRLGGRAAPGHDAVVAGADALASGLATGQLRDLAASGAPGEDLTPRIVAVMGLLDRGIAPDAALVAEVSHAGFPTRPPHAPASIGGTDGPSPVVPTAIGRERRPRPRPPARELPSPGSSSSPT